YVYIYTPPIRDAYSKGPSSKQNFGIFWLSLIEGASQKSAFMGLTCLVNTSQNLEKSGPLKRRTCRRLPQTSRCGSMHHGRVQFDLPRGLFCSETGVLR